VPRPDESKATIDWESEIVSELRSADMYDEMVGMASEEFENHIKDLRKMQKQLSSEWGSWPPWQVAHSIKGVCLNLSFSRLAGYFVRRASRSTTSSKLFLTWNFSLPQLSRRRKARGYLPAPLTSTLELILFLLQASNYGWRLGDGSDPVARVVASTGGLRLSSQIVAPPVNTLLKSYSDNTVTIGM